MIEFFYHPLLFSGKRSGFSFENILFSYYQPLRRQRFSI